jgi:hypothetical protein
MATIQPTFRKVDDYSVMFTYANMTFSGSDVGAPIKGNWGVYGDRTVQVEGTLGAGGTVAMQGSNDGGVNWRTINDAFGVALNVTALSVEQFTERPEQFRPAITAGDGTTSVTVSLLLHRQPSSPN